MPPSAPAFMTASAYRGYTLYSAFQPIFSLYHRRTVGFEALIRPRLGRKSGTPSELISFARGTGEGRTLDAICQRTHIQNFATQHPEHRWLFLNLDPTTITRRWYGDGQLLDTLAAAGLAPEQLVIELLEGRIADEAALFDAVTFFREAGAQVALDDFGAGHSNFDRLWRLEPNIIKLDRSLIAEAEQHRESRLRRILPNLVDLIHEAGSLVVCEGVETEAQAMVALDSDVDFVQGFYFGRPGRQIDMLSGLGTTRLLRLDGRHAAASARAESREKSNLKPGVAAFAKAATRLAQGEHFADAVEELIGLSSVARVYLLNEDGEELDQIVAVSLRPNTRMAPVIDGAGGLWYRRPYFRAAIDDPGQIQTSRPYLSITGDDMCVTLSVARVNAPHNVFCCDILV